MLCEDVVGLLPEHLSAIGALRGLDPAAGGQVIEVHEHLRGCATCAEVGDELLRTVHALREAPPAPALSTDFADRVMAALPVTPAGLAPSTSSGSSASSGSPAPARGLAVLAAGALVFAAGFGAATLRAGGQKPAGGAPAPSIRVETPPPQHRGQVVADDGHAPSPVPPLTPLTPVAAPAAPRPYAPLASPRGRVASSSESLERYVEEAGLVVRALGALEEPDPHWLGVLSRRVEGAALISEGDRLLVALDRAPASEDALAVRPLITATQVVLRKVRRSAGRASGVDSGLALDALRHEVVATGLLDAYRDLAEGHRLGDGRAGAPASDQPSTVASGPTDPL